MTVPTPVSSSLWHFFFFSRATNLGEKSRDPHIKMILAKKETMASLWHFTVIQRTNILIFFYFKITPTLLLNSSSCGHGCYDLLWTTPGSKNIVWILQRRETESKISEDVTFPQIEEYSSCWAKLKEGGGDRLSIRDHEPDFFFF